MNICLFYVLDKYNVIIAIITLRLNITIHFGTYTIRVKYIYIYIKYLLHYVYIVMRITKSY